MNLVKLIPYNLRERIRKILFGKNHFHDISEFAVQIGCRVAFDVGTQYGYEAILFAKAGMEVYAFEPDSGAMKGLCENRVAEKVKGSVYASGVHVSDICSGDQPPSITLRFFMDSVGVRPDFLKIDTDGDDIKVLNGYPFDKHRPMLLSVEYDTTGAVDRKLLSEGYNLIYAIYKPQTRARRAIFSRYSLSPEFYGDEWGDVIAVLPEHYVALRDKLFGF